MSTPTRQSKTGSLGLALAALLAGAGLAPRAADAAVVVRTAVNYRPYRPVARAAVGAAVVTGAAVATAAVVGSTVHTLPPQCSSVVVNGIAYQQCGSAWYQPHYAGSQVTYVVVNPPR
jgi:hypothetical protein